MLNNVRTISKNWIPISVYGKYKIQNVGNYEAEYVITDAATIPEINDRGIEIYINEVKNVEVLDTQELWIKTITNNITTIVLEKDTSIISTSYQELIDRVSSLENNVTSINLQLTQYGSRISYLESVATSLPTSVESIRFVSVGVTTSEIKVPFTRNTNFYGFKEDLSKLVINEITDTITFKQSIKYGYSPYLIIRTTNNNTVTINTAVKNLNGDIVASSQFVVPGKSPSQTYSEVILSKFQTIDNVIIDNSCSVYVVATSTGLSIIDGTITINS